VALLIRQQVLSVLVACHWDAGSLGKRNPDAQLLAAIVWFDGALDYSRAESAESQDALGVCNLRYWHALQFAAKESSNNNVSRLN